MNAHLILPLIFIVGLSESVAEIKILGCYCEYQKLQIANVFGLVD